MPAIAGSGRSRIYLAGDPAHSCPDGIRLLGVSVAPAASIPSPSMTQPSMTVVLRPDKSAVFQCRAVQHDHMADQHIVTDNRRMTVWGGRGGAITVDGRAILNIAARANFDEIHVCPNHAIIPDAGFGSDFDIADNLATRRNKCRFVNLRCFAVKGQDKRISHASGFQSLASIR